MDTARAAKLARLVEAAGADLTTPDLVKRRLGRLERVQAAWLRDLKPRSMRAAVERQIRADARSRP
jgi:hypothetical protein